MEERPYACLGIYDFPQTHNFGFDIANNRNWMFREHSDYFGGTRVRSIFVDQLSPFAKGHHVRRSSSGPMLEGR